MKKRVLSLMIILIVLLSGFDCKCQDKWVIATLTSINGNDSLLNAFIIPDSSKFDLKLCLEKFGYPPKIPTNIFWIKPDTAGFSNFEKQNIITKYQFDNEGKLSMYYYQGSLISGVFPLSYYFDYNKDNLALISEIIDEFYNIKYLVKYDNLMNIQCIEKLDSDNKRIEILTINIK